MSAADVFKGQWSFLAGVVCGPDKKPVCYLPTTMDRERAIAIGKAIAALPELLEACRAAAALDTTGGMGHSLGDQVYAVTSARAALRLAVGG